METLPKTSAPLPAKTLTQGPFKLFQHVTLTIANITEHPCIIQTRTFAKEFILLGNGCRKVKFKPRTPIKKEYVEVVRPLPSPDQ